MRKDQIKSTIDRMLDEKIIDYWGRPVKLCEKCNSFPSHAHQNEYCLNCPGKMIAKPGMTWRNLLLHGKSSRGKGELGLPDFTHWIFAESTDYTYMEIIEQQEIFDEFVNFCKKYQISQLVKSRLGLASEPSVK